MNLLKIVQSPLPSLMQFWYLMVVFSILLLSIAEVFIWDIRYKPFGEDEDGI